MLVRLWPWWTSPGLGWAGLLLSLPEVVCSKELMLSNELLFFSKEPWKLIFLAWITHQVEKCFYLIKILKKVTYPNCSQDEKFLWLKPTLSKQNKKQSKVRPFEPSRTCQVTNSNLTLNGHLSEPINPQVCCTWRTNIKYHWWSLDWYPPLLKAQPFALEKLQKHPV